MFLSLVSHSIDILMKKILLALLLFTSSSVQALVYEEGDTDAGDVPYLDSVRDIPDEIQADLTEIRGYSEAPIAAGLPADVDVYLIQIYDLAAFSVEVTSFANGHPNGNSELFLFSTRGNGRKVAENDNYEDSVYNRLYSRIDSSSFDPEFELQEEVEGEGETFALAVGRFALAWFDDLNYGTAAGEWIVNAAGFASNYGSYTLRLTGTTAPASSVDPGDPVDPVDPIDPVDPVVSLSEPSVAPLFLLGLVSLCFMRRFSRFFSKV